MLIMEFKTLKGDSGSGIYQYDSDHRPYVIGIASSSHLIRATQPDVHTSVPFHLGWMRDVMSRESEDDDLQEILQLFHGL